MRWEDYLYHQTPVEQVGPIFLKREDKFAPLGPNNINGSKLRQLIWLFNHDMLNSHTGSLIVPDGVASGAVRGSPQHAMVAAVAQHYGMPCVQFVGGKGEKDSDMVRMARAFGAEIRYVNPGYAATLNSKAKAFAAERKYLHIQTNITVDAPQHEVQNFHLLGSMQVQSIPDHIETLIVPAGSCNSAVSVLYGIHRFRPRNLRTVVLLGIGSYGSRDPLYILDRLGIVKPDAPQDFAPRFLNNEDLPQGEADAPYELLHYNLNGLGYCKYEDMMPYDHHGIAMHPRYEGKCFNFMTKHYVYAKHFEKWWNEKTCFWVVGSMPGEKK